MVEFFEKRDGKRLGEGIGLIAKKGRNGKFRFVLFGFDWLVCAFDFEYFAFPEKEGDV